MPDPAQSGFPRGLRRAGPARLLLFAPLLIAALSLPMALRLVPPNAFYGFRTTRSLHSPELWYAANFQAGVAGVLLGLAGALLVHAILRSRRIAEITRVLLAAGVLLLVAFGSLLAGLLAS